MVRISEHARRKLAERLADAFIDVLEEVAGELAGPDAPPAPTAPAEMTVTEAARYLGRSRSWLYERMADGTIPWFPSPGSPRGKRLRRTDLDAYLVSKS